MSNLAFRENTILPADSGDSEPVFGTSYTVIAYEVGAVASAASTDTTIPVYSGHGFATNDRLIVGTDESTFVKVTGTSANELTVDTPTDVAVGDLLVNLGVDLGSGTPAYDTSPIQIYDDPAGESTQLTSALVTCNAQGLYKYWHSTAGIWELVRDSSGTPVAVIPDAVVGSVIGPASSVDNAIVRFDGTTGKKIQGYTSGAPTVGDTGAVTIPSTLTVTGAAVLNGGLTMDTDKFTVADTTGNTLVGGTFGVTGATTLSSTLAVNGAATLSSTLAVTGAVTLSALLNLSVETGITAFSTGGQANATQLTKGVNEISVVAATDDSVKLPVASIGAVCRVINNDAAQAAKIYPQTGEQIGSGAANAGAQIGTAQMHTYVKTTATRWEMSSEVLVDGS